MLGMFRLPVLFATLTSLYAGLLAAQPCQEKQWIDTPIIVFAQGKKQGQSESGDSIGGTGRGFDGAGSGDGIGGTGRGSDTEGIGGTGRAPSESGRYPGQQLGFIGVIAGFASICVNGQEIHFSPGTTIRIDGKAGDAAQLKLGQMVSVAAGNTGSAQPGEYHAIRIDIFNTLRGPLQEIDAAKGTLRVLGQTLVGAENGLNLADFRTGDYLIANGSRLPNGEILLTRLEQASPQEEVSLLGPVTQLEGNTFRIFNAHIQTSNALAATLHVGQEVFVSGRLISGTILADSVTLDPQLHFGKTVRRLDLQGHIRRMEGTEQLNVGGTDIRLDSTAKVNGDLKNLSEGLRIKVSATIEADGRIVAERIRIERPPKRPDNLAPLGNLERNAPPRGSEGVDNGLPSLRPEPPMRPEPPIRPDRPVRGAELERPRPEMVRPEIVRPVRPPDRISPR